MNKMVIGGVVAGGLMVGAAALVIGAGVAKASPSAYGEDTTGFVGALRADGFTGVEPTEAVQMGRAVCRMLRGGDSEHEIVTWLVSPPHPVNRIAATAFVSDAHTYLCPGVSGAEA